MIGVEFISASTAGIVHVELGFEPDFCVLFSDHGATNPNVYFWANGGTGKTFPGWAAALSLKLEGAATVSTTARTMVRDTTGIALYAGGDVIASAETANTAGKHIDLDGNPAAAAHVTAKGISIPADHQANSGRNLLLAFRHEA